MERNAFRRQAATRIALAALVTAAVLGGVGRGGHGGHTQASVRPTPTRAAAAIVTTHALQGPTLETSRARPSYSPCTTNSEPKLIVVSIRRQHEWACAGHRTVMQTAVTTGASSKPGFATPRGTFAVQGINRNTSLDTGGRRYAVKYWIPFHLGVWGFHDASWQAMPFGSPAYSTRGSRGCVHMPLPAIRWLANWVSYGTPVSIR